MYMYKLLCRPKAFCLSLLCVHTLCPCRTLLYVTQSHINVYKYNLIVHAHVYSWIYYSVWLCSGDLIGSLSFLEASVITSFTIIILRGSVCMSFFFLLLAYLFKGHILV